MMCKYKDAKKELLKHAEVDETYRYSTMFGSSLKGVDLRMKYITPSLIHFMFGSDLDFEYLGMTMYDVFKKEGNVLSGERLERYEKNVSVADKICIESFKEIYKPRVFYQVAEFLNEKKILRVSKEMRPKGAKYQKGENIFTVVGFPTDGFSFEENLKDLKHKEARGRVVKLNNMLWIEKHKDFDDARFKSL